MKRSLFRVVHLRRAGLAGLLALALAACGGGDSSIGEVVAGGDPGATPAPTAPSPDPAAPSTDPAVTSTVLSSAAVDADIKTLLALSAAERERQARVSSAQVERELLTISGVEAELGGAAATDAAYSSVAKQFVADAASTGASIIKRSLPPAGPAQVAKAAADESVSGALFAGYMQVALLTNSLGELGELKPGESKELGNKDAPYQGALTLEKLTYNATYPHTANGLDATLKTHLEFVACPDANGVFTSKATFEASMTKSGGATGQRATFEVSVTGHVNDNADLAYYDIDTRMQMAEFVNRKGAYVDVSLNYPVGDSPRAASGKVNRAAGQATEAFAKNAYDMGKTMSLLIAIQMASSAEKAWQSGRCVALDPTTNPAQRTGLQPSTAVAITAAPRSKIDGGPVGGSVTGTLSGDGTLAPSGTKVPADASFTYTAPGTAAKAGKVSLEARSRRGVAKAELNFDTAEDSWTGTASFRDDITSATAQITWVLVNRENNVSMYKATGTGTVSYDDRTCSYPTAATSVNGSGILFVDFNTTPPTYHGAGTSGTASVTITCTFSDHVETHVGPAAAPVFGGTKGTEGVEAAGSVTLTQDAPMTIEGSDTDGVGGTFHWSFRRGR